MKIGRWLKRARRRRKKKITALSNCNNSKDNNNNNKDEFADVSDFQKSLLGAYAAAAHTMFCEGIITAPSRYKFLNPRQMSQEN